jgi:EAL domain-containing protein (putative c-di-GMP-specific phosphodiesterase class I)
MIARIGGDEFAVLIADCAGAADALRRARGFLALLEEPIHLGGHQVRPTASIGLALNHTGNEKPADLLRFADVAMYRAKGVGGSPIEVFDVTRDRLEVERLQREADLWRAIERRQLVLHFQPIHRLDDGTVWGAEALLRWRHPERGLILPDELIPLAEECGAIVPIGEWVLAEACRRTRRWQAEHGRPDLRVGVNVSSSQLRDPAFPLRAGRLVAETGIDASTVLLELSENAMIDGARAVEELRERTGVAIAIDDFGTGYASLSCLKGLPIDVLKVDRAFVRELPDNHVDHHLLESVQRFCDNVRLQTIAEGVETAEQAALLAGLGYELGQGYHFARPMTARAYGRYLLRAARTAMTASLPRATLPAAVRPRPAPLGVPLQLAAQGG